MKKKSKLPIGKRDLLFIALSLATFFIHFSLLIRIALFFSTLGTFKLGDAAIQRITSSKNNKNTGSNNNVEIINESPQQNTNPTKRKNSLQKIIVNIPSTSASTPASASTKPLTVTFTVPSTTFPSKEKYPERLNTEVFNDDAQRNDIIFHHVQDKSTSLEIHTKDLLKSHENKEKAPSETIKAFLTDKIEPAFIDFFITAFNQYVLLNCEHAVIAELLMEIFKYFPQGGSEEGLFNTPIVEILDSKTLEIKQTGGYHQVFNPLTNLLYASEDHVISFSHTYQLKLNENNQVEYQCVEFKMTLSPDFIEKVKPDEIDNLRQSLDQNIFNFPSPTSDEPKSHASSPKLLVQRKTL